MRRFQKSVCIFVVTLGIVLAATVIVRAYAIYAKWNANSVCYQYSRSLPTSFKSPTEAGANTWNNEGGANFSFSRCSQNHVWWYGYIDGVGGTGASTTLAFYWQSGQRIMVDADTVYDSGESWWTYLSPPPSNKLDVWSVAAHEFGHWLSLDHSCTSPDGKIPTMCIPINYGTSWARTLAQDDKNGIQALYP